MIHLILKYFINLFIYTFVHVLTKSFLCFFHMIAKHEKLHNENFVTLSIVINI
jgi:hypothetical protein